MAIARISNFGGVRPRASARALPDDAAQTANNLLATTAEFRTLAADSTIVNATGVTNPQTIYRMQRLAGGALNLDFASAANWKISAAPKSYVKGALNDNTTERTYVTFDDASQAPRVIDATGQDRQLGVPAPGTAPAITVNVVDEFTPEDRSTALQAAFSAVVTSIETHVIPGWRGADHPGTATTGLADRTAAFGFTQENGAQEVRMYRLSGVGGAVSNSYSGVDPSNFSWVFDPLLAAFPVSSAGSLAWAGADGTPHIAIAFPAYGLTYDIDTAALTADLAAMPMPGKTDGTKLWTTAQVAQIVAVMVQVTDPAGTTVKPMIDAIRSKVQELRVLLDGGGRASLAAMLQAFYSKSDVAAEITAAISNFANNVFQQADLVARSSLPADFAGGGDSGQ